MATVEEAGRKGGSMTSDKKRVSSKANAIKAREMKLLYRMNPALKGDKPYGNKR